jgi:hypothetical protein
VCTPNTPPDNDSVNEGVCAAGPIDQFCNLESFRPCAVDSDCPTAGDTCSVFKNRECFTDNGIVGASVSVAGAASPTAPAFGALFCNPPSTSGIVNAQAGIPSLGRWTIPGSATMN